MKKFLLSVIVCAFVLLNLVVAGPAEAGLFANATIGAEVKANTAVQDLITQLEEEVLPKLETILTPEQREQFKSLIAQGSSFRKAFKSITLTPEEKKQLKSLLSSLPKKDAFASLTPEQKKQLFMKKRELFKPTPADMSERISQGMRD